MIYVSEEQAAQVKYLLEQAIQGNHILFDPESIRKIFNSKQNPTFSQSQSSTEKKKPVEHHLEKLMSLKTLPEKKLYLERLNSETYEAVVRSYLHIVENTLFEETKVTH